MDYSVNTRPLLQGSDSETDEDTSQSQHLENEEGDDEGSINKDVNPLFKIGSPKDKYHVAYIIFYLLGMTTLLPWNFFITANQYWMHKLHEVPKNTTLGLGGRTALQAEFTSYLSVASNVPNTIFLVANTLLSHKIPLGARMIGSLLSILMLFILTTSLVYVDTDPWQQGFFILTLSSVVIVNIGSAIMQGGLYGVVGCFPQSYITAVVGGQALGGVFAALANIASIAMGASPEASALTYFLVADVVLVSSMLAYLGLSSTSFFKFHMASKSRSVAVYTPVVEGEEVMVHRPVSYQAIFNKIWVHCFTIWMLFVVTLAVFPAVTVLISSIGEGNKNPWNDIYFVPVIGYLLFNSCDYIGRLLAGWLHRPRKHSWIMAIVSVLRIAFIPLLMLCNAHPRKTLPVLMDTDLDYILIITFFALSNGYLANITFICVPNLVESYEQETAASMMAAFLGLGTSCGSALSLLMVRLL